MEAKRKESPTAAASTPRPARKRRKRKWYPCQQKGCTNRAQIGGVCVRHGAIVKKKLCTHKGCTNHAHSRGVCVTHGAPLKRCRHYGGCTNRAQVGGVCIKHGAKIKKCSHEGCTHHVVKGGVCVTHGARLKRCAYEGCDKKAVNGGVCFGHGAKVKICQEGGCPNLVRKGGFCLRHYRSRVKAKKYSGKNNEGQKEEICCSHFAKRKLCGGDTNNIQKGGSRRRHRTNVKHEFTGGNGKDGSIKNNRDHCNSTSRKNDGSNTHEKQRGSTSSSTDHVSSTIIRPTRGTLQHIRTMSPSIQRELISQGMRIKVRFHGNNWYGGVISNVAKNGSVIHINYDDGTQETVDKFPDWDVIVDDVGNGKHIVDATAFVPQMMDNNVVGEDKDDDKDEDKDSICEDQRDYDSEEELGALIYRRSVTARLMTDNDNAS